MFFYRALEENKNTQSINNPQVECMCTFMEKHDDLAKGVLQAANGRQKSKNLWHKLTTELNEKGPPVREVHMIGERL